MKMGSVPKIRATVAAVASETEYVKLTWLRTTPMSAAGMRYTKSRRSIRILPSRISTTATKITAPITNRNDEKAMGSKPCVTA